MLMKLNDVVIFVVAQNLNSMIYKVIIWQLDNLLSSTKEKKKTTRISETGENELVTNNILMQYYANKNSSL